MIMINLFELWRILCVYLCISMYVSDRCWLILEYIANQIEIASKFNFLNKCHNIYISVNTYVLKCLTDETNSIFFFKSIFSDM